jgi:DNA-binding PadR family transcriptional regulator
MARRSNLTYTTGIVLQCIAQGYRYGFDIMDRSGLPDGTVYPALRRLEQAGALEAEWEPQGHAQEQRRPPRRYYSLTASGEELLQRARARFPGLGAAETGGLRQGEV